MTLTTLPVPSARTDQLSELPVAVIGAGPVGLAAAAHVIERGLPVVVYEVGESAGAAIAQWGHTRLFSPWEYVVDAASVRLLEKTGWESPEAKALPYGRDLVADYLLPLSRTPELARAIRFRATVTAVSRQGMDRTRSTGRESRPFVLRVDRDGQSTDELARAVIDTSGTYRTPNGIIASGLNPVHMDEVQSHITHALPDVLGAERARFAGTHTLVVGAGHSAANTLIALTTLAEEEPGTSVTWAIRNQNPARVYTAEIDELPARANIGERVHQLVRQGRIAFVDEYEIDTVEPTADGRVQVVGRRGGKPTTIEAETIVAATGFRPNLDMLREIRLSLDEIVEAPRTLAPLIDPNLHSCGTVPPHGVTELTQPEANFFLAGMKSYGRAPTFLLATGYEQVRSIADELAGNKAAARTVQLVLPETGVCSSDESGSSCC